MKRDRIARFFEARQADWRARNAETLAAAHAESGSVISPMFGALNGRAEIQGAYVKLFEMFPDWYFRSEELIIDGDRVVQRFTAMATLVGGIMGLSEGTNRQGRIEGALFFTMGKDLIEHERRMYDFSGLLIQIGVLRSRPNF
jgi:predicted ester cyclase